MRFGSAAIVSVQALSPVGNGEDMSLRTKVAIADCGRRGIKAGIRKAAMQVESANGQLLFARKESETTVRPST